MLSLLFMSAVGLGCLSGSIWLFTAVIRALLAKLFPLLLMLLAIGGSGILAFNHYRK